MPNFGTRITKIVKGHRVMEYIEIVPNYKVTFLGEPENISFRVGSEIFSRNQVGVFPDGEYPYTASVPGDSSYGEESGSFTVAGGDLIISETLLKNTYKLSIHAESTADSTLENVDVYLNDKLIGKTDASGNISATVLGGSYNVIGRREGFVPATSSITVSSNRNLSIVLSAVSTAPQDGIVSVTSSPTNAEVYINGAYAGVTPMTKTLSPNSYTFSLKKSGYRDYIGSFRIEAGNATSVSGALVPIQVGANIYFTSNVQGAQVSNSSTGEVLGYTNLNVNVAGNTTHYFVARKSGYNDNAFSIYVQEGTSNNYYIDMKQIVDYPAKGILIETYCQGYTKYGRYHDGVGGSYTAVVEENAVSCGFPVKGRVRIQDDVTYSDIYVYKHPLTVAIRPAGTTALPNPDYKFSKSNAFDTTVELPAGTYSVISFSKIAMDNPEYLIPLSRSSKTAILTVTDTTQNYFVKVDNYKQIRNRAFVSIEFEVNNGTLTDYATRDTFGSMAYSILRSGDAFTVSSALALSIVGNPTNQNGLHIIRNTVSYAKKYGSNSYIRQENRGNWNFNFVLDIIPGTAGVVEQAAILPGTQTYTEAVITTGGGTYNKTPTSNGFFYHNVNNTSRIVISYGFTVGWLEEE